jgi:hypothetical protein
MRFALVLLVFSALGCERIGIVKQCRALAQRVNPELAAIEASTQAKPDAKTYAEVATRYRELAKEVGAFDAGVPEIDRAADDYATTLSSSALHVADLAKALDGGNPASAALAKRALEQEAKRQKNVVKRFGQECMGH